jgi:hypothetical protein
LNVGTGLTAETVRINDAEKYTRFTAGTGSISFTTTPPLTVDYLVVAGGGGNGGLNSNGTDGSANTGGGGGGGGSTTVGPQRNGGAGGSGVVLIKIPSAYTAAFSAGLTTTANTTAISGSRIYSVTAGTGTVTFSLT